MAPNLLRLLPAAETFAHGFARTAPHIADDAARLARPLARDAAPAARYALPKGTAPTILATGAAGSLGYLAVTQAPALGDGVRDVLGGAADAFRGLGDLGTGLGDAVDSAGDAAEKTANNLPFLALVALGLGAVYLLANRDKEAKA